jgi:hypothetical protein
VAPHAHLSRHYGWRRTITAGPAVPTWQHLLRHRRWCRTFLSSATLNGAAKKGYSGEIFSPMVYYLNSFHV